MPPSANQGYGALQSPNSAETYEGQNIKIYWKLRQVSSFDSSTTDSEVPQRYKRHYNIATPNFYALKRKNISGLPRSEEWTDLSLCD